MRNKIYVILEDVDEGYNSIIAFNNLNNAEKYLLNHSRPDCRLIIDEVVLND